MNLTELGSRIAIIGPSSSGKSTLANRLATKIGAPVFHLDQMAHKPYSNWERRPDGELVAEHNQALLGETWVMDGNYSICMPQRFARATSVIWLDLSFIGFLWRYLLRCWYGKGDREGGLQGALGEFNFRVIRYTFWNYPKNRRKYERLLRHVAIPVLKIGSVRELNCYYRRWSLTR